MNNDKVYIGLTNNVEKRWYKHRWYALNKQKSSRLYNAMRKHGINNFNFEVLEDSITSIEEAHAREKFFVEQHESHKSGYNATPGGTGGDMSDYDNWKLAVKKMHEQRDRKSYATRGFKSKTHKKESIEKLSAARKDYWDKLSLQERVSFSKKISGESNGMFGKKPKNSVQITYNGVQYDSLAAAARQTGHSTKFLKKHGEISQ
jgi:group I intron endonuclease